ncbi:protein tyrosine kinase [Ancylostoma ceylanicum]|uniref:non-specific protein-tyrosine kinase n=1 Tax=Ancylostoma ceylanicum TaxID=53326 RepID=A0A0D6LAL8_9BILA|nr:protein tyrosine kinase [Ancylostoma ceylanicum]
MHACRDMSGIITEGGSNNKENELETVENLVKPSWIFEASPPFLEVTSPPQEIQQYAYPYDDGATEFKWILCTMELPDVVKEKLVELDDQNNQLRSEVIRLRATVANKDEILNELEEENVQLRKTRQNDSSETSKCAYLEQTVTSLKVALEEKNRDIGKMVEQIEALTGSLSSAQAEIAELQRARTPISPERSVISEPSNCGEMIRLQEERDDAIFELQRANYRVSALESERDDLIERAEAANAEAREMARHLKEQREQLHEMEAELAASRNNVSIANRGNSMFAEATGRCRCQELSPELVQLRGRVQTLEARLSQAKNELIDMARVTKGIDPRLKSFYRSLKLEMESLREERDKFRDERDKLVDEKAGLSARLANAEKLVEYANDDVEGLKLQLAMMKERDEKKDAAKVSDLINGKSNEEEHRLSSILHPVQSTPATCEKPVVQTPMTFPCLREAHSPRIAPNTPAIPSDLQCSLNSSFGDSAKIPTEVRMKKLRFADNTQNDDDDAQRRESISASELRRIARKQARRARSKVLPIAEPLIKVAAKISNSCALPTKQCIMEKDALESIVSCSSQGEESLSLIESSSSVFSAQLYGISMSKPEIRARRSKSSTQTKRQNPLKFDTIVPESDEKSNFFNQNTGSTGGPSAPSAPVTEWYGSSGVPLEDEPFYHGYMERKETERCLTKNGEFLVRKSVIRNNESISDLIRYHQTLKIPVYEGGVMLQSHIVREQWQLYHEQVVLGCRLGHGEFGEVFKGSLTVGLFTKPIEVAVKTLKEGSLSSDDRVTFLREANVMLKLQHKYVIRLYGVATQKEPIMIVMELATGGSLLDKVRKNRVDLNRKRKYCFHAISGMEYLETQQVIHRDLAARNCLISASDACKISDFGLSLLGRLHKEKHMVKVPIRWLAPETLKQGTYSNKSDVWSCGVLMYEVFTNGEIPYKEVQALRDVRKSVIGGLRLKPPPDMPAEDAAVMLLCFETEPLARASFAELKARYLLATKEHRVVSDDRYSKMVDNGKEDDDAKYLRQQLEDHTYDTSPFRTETLIQPFFRYKELFKDEYLAKNYSIVGRSLGRIKFAVLRDPIDRFLSGFVDKCIMYCNFKEHLEDYIFVRYQKCTNGIATYAREFDKIFRMARVPEDLRREIQSEILVGRTPHTTRGSGPRYAAERELFNNRTLLDIVMKMFYFDYKVFGFSLPDEL